MTINGSRFLFDGSSSDEYGVVLGYIGSPNTDSNDDETNIITTKSLFKDTWDLHFVEDAAPLQFKITVVRDNAEIIDADFQRALKKWLCKKKRAWLQIDQDDLANVFYRCLIANPKPNNIEGKTYGFDFDVICDSGHAWSELQKRDYTSNGTNTFQYHLTTDYDNYIVRPFLTIVPTVNGTISLRNNTINKTMSISNCVVGEIIKIDCLNHKMESSNGRILLDSWNKQYFEFVEELNSVTLEGNFTLNIQYRLPVRIGG